VPESALLVLADEQDHAARAFVQRHRGAGARLLCPADLSRPGWVYRVGRARQSVAMTAEGALPAAHIRGVVTRLSVITPSQLAHVHEADRDYVAAEIGAFLLAWLHALPCPVMNRPVAPSLAGPVWPWERWARLAGERGLPVVMPRRVVGRGAAPAPAAVPARLRLDVVGAQVIGPHHPVLAERARELALAAEVVLLGALFDGAGDDARLVGVDPWPDLSQADVGQALIHSLP
jgi:hypothetical protein